MILEPHGSQRKKTSTLLIISLSALKGLISARTGDGVLVDLGVMYPIPASTVPYTAQSPFCQSQAILGPWSPGIHLGPRNSWTPSAT
jgi:hypothetical protein